jgi:hypothetical protein
MLVGSQQSVEVVWRVRPRVRLSDRERSAARECWQQRTQINANGTVVDFFRHFG